MRLVWECEGIHGMSDGFVGVEDFGEDSVEDIEDFEEDCESSAECVGGFGLIVGGYEGEAIADS